jgi:hypothetical protein
MTDNDEVSDRLPSRLIVEFILVSLFAVGVLARIAWELYFHELTTSHPVWAKFMCLAGTLLATGIIFENWKGLRLGKTYRIKLNNLEVQKQTLRDEKRVAEAGKLTAETALGQYKATAEGFAILDLFDDVGRIKDRIRKHFREQSPTQKVVIIGSFNQSNSQLSLETILEIKKEFPDTGLVVIDTQLPFPKKDELVRVLKDHENTSYYLDHSLQIFDPILIFSRALVFSFMSKCFFAPIKAESEESGIQSALEQFLNNCFVMHPDYGKKLEYFSEALRLLHTTIESLREDGYSFSATHSGLWFSEPLNMSTQTIDKIKNEMDHHFQMFSDNVLSQTSAIVANWPLTVDSDLSLVTSKSVITWTKTLRERAEVSANQLAIRRYLYVSAEHHWDPVKGINMIHVNGKRWRDRVTNVEKGFDEIIMFLRTNFLEAPDNYKSYVVLVPSNTAELTSALARFSNQSSSLIDMAELLSNWIIFNCDQYGFNILQYERNYPYVLPSEQSSFYAFYYNDFGKQDGTAVRRVNRYSLYSHLLDTAAMRTEKKILENPDAFKRETVHVLPIKTFFERLDDGQIIIGTAGRHATPGA